MADRSDKQPHQPPAAESSQEEPLFPVRGYVILNVVFWAFCIVEILIIRWWLRDIQGVIFFFALLAIGFTLVSIYDALYDRAMARSRKSQGQAPPAA